MLAQVILLVAVFGSFALFGHIWIHSERARDRHIVKLAAIIYILAGPVLGVHPLTTTIAAVLGFVSFLITVKWLIPAIMKWKWQRPIRKKYRTWRKKLTLEHTIRALDDALRQRLEQGPDGDLDLDSIGRSLEMIDDRVRDLRRIRARDQKEMKGLGLHSRVIGEPGSALRHLGAHIRDRGLDEELIERTEREVEDVRIRFGLPRSQS